MTEHKSLAEALAAFQANLPRIRKTATGQVGQNRNYKYADLADVTHEVVPELAKYGLSWLAMPTLNEAGQFVLRYELLHVSGESRVGEYELPSGVGPQQIGSAITYGRRYTLTSVTGVVADEDDDGAAFADTRTQQRPRQARPAEAAPDTAGQARADLAAFAQEKGLQLPVVGAEYAKRSGKGLGDETDPNPIRAFLAQLRRDPQAILSDAPKAAA